MSDPRNTHWQAVKLILQYLRGTTDGLMFDKISGLDGCTVGFVNSDYVGDHDMKRSLTGYVFTLYSCVVSWKTILQSTVVLSATEAKHMAMTEAVKEAI